MFGSLTLMPDARCAVSTSRKVVEMMSWNDCRIMLATDQLTPALIKSHTTRVDSICTIDAVGSEISETFISQEAGIIFFTPFGF